ncbi:MAG: YheU family protein [Pseudomonadota bacterium]|nr:YheU family protein [Pseudomonadota bacterium]
MIENEEARELADGEPAAGQPVHVPHAELSADLLHAVVESFVLREGTDYGEQELTLEAKVARVIVQLKRGEVKIIFDPESDSVTIIPGQSNGAPKR